MTNNTLEVAFFKIPLDYRMDVAIAKAIADLVIAFSNGDDYCHQKALMKSIKEYSSMLASILLISKVSYELSYAFLNGEFFTYFQTRWADFINDATWGIVNLVNWCKNFPEVFCHYAILIGFIVDCVVSCFQLWNNPSRKLSWQILIQLGLIAAMACAIGSGGLIVPVLLCVLPFLNYVREGYYSSSPSSKMLCKFAAQVAVMSLLLFSGLGLPALIGAIAAIGIIMHLTLNYGLNKAGGEVLLRQDMAPA